LFESYILLDATGSLTRKPKSGCDKSSKVCQFDFPSAAASVVLNELAINPISSRGSCIVLFFAISLIFQIDLVFSVDRWTTTDESMAWHGIGDEGRDVDMRNIDIIDSDYMNRTK